MSRAVRFSYRNARAWSPSYLAGLQYWVDSRDAPLASGTVFSGGSGTTLSFSSGTMTLTSSTGFGGLAAQAKGSTVVLTGCTNSGNNGSFSVTSYPSANAIQFANPAGVAETMPASSSWATSGGAGPIVDRRSGHSFASPASNANKWSLNTTLVPGKQVLSGGFSSGTTGKSCWLECTSSSLASVFGTQGPASWVSRVYFAAASYPHTLMALRSAAVGSSPADYAYAYPTTSAALQYVRNDPSSSTTWGSITSLGLTTGTWYTLGMSDDGDGASGSVKAYVNGAYIGADAASRTVRNFTAASLVLGNCGTTNATGATPSGGNQHSVQCWMGATAAWSAQDFQRVHDWYASEFA